MRPPVVQLDEPEEGSRVRMGAVLGGVLVVLLVGAFAWLASDTPATPDTPAPPQAARLRNIWTPAPAASAVGLEAVALPASAPVGVPPGHVEVCGVGFVKESEWTSEARQDAMAQSVRTTRKAAIAALKARGDERSLAVALALESFRGDPQPEETAACEGADCPTRTDPNAAWQAARRRVAANRAPRDELARLAVRTTDPEVYGLAYRLCAMYGRDDADSACRMLSAEQWVRLDPGNGSPWFAVAEQAKARGDRAAVAEALHRVGRASSLDGHFGRLAQRVIEAASPDAPVLESFELAGEAFAIQPLDMGGLSTLSLECSAAAVRDANRAQECAAFAESLWQHGTTMIDWSIASALASRLGWPPERLQAMRDERDALTHASASLVGAPTLGCDAIRRQTGYMARVGQLGEIGALRERMRASGRSIEELARDGRRAREAILRSADAAPSVPLVR